MTSWIMDFSWSESSSASATMYLISSSETLSRSSADLMPSSAERPLADLAVSQTSGRARCMNPRMGPATDFAMRSASESAMRLGTSSPTTMER